MKAIDQDRYGEGRRPASRGHRHTACGQRRGAAQRAGGEPFAGDWHYMAGMPLAFRPASGLTKPKVRVRGRDVAGRVEALGPDVTQFEVGEAVYEGKIVIIV